MDLTKLPSEMLTSFAYIFAAACVITVQCSSHPYQTIQTDGQRGNYQVVGYSWDYFTTIPGSSYTGALYVHFQVKTCYDAHISLGYYRQRWIEILHVEITQEKASITHTPSGTTATRRREAGEPHPISCNVHKTFFITFPPGDSQGLAKLIMYDDTFRNKDITVSIQINTAGSSDIDTVKVSTGSSEMGEWFFYSPGNSDARHCCEPILGNIYCDEPNSGCDYFTQKNDNNNGPAYLKKCSVGTKWRRDYCRCDHKHLVTGCNVLSGPPGRR